MKAAELHQRDFEINVNLNGKQKTIQVNPDETTDGIEYFQCKLAGKNITQVRKEKDGNWEQLWGELNQQTIDAIGSAITKIVT